jgi:hypothetical protein
MPSMEEVSEYRNDQDQGLASCEMPTRAERWDDSLEVWRDLRALHVVKLVDGLSEASTRRYVALFMRASELDGSSFETVGNELCDG